MGADAQIGKGVNQRARIRMTDVEIDDFLHGDRTMSLASLNADGTIHVVAMWYGFLEGALAFSTKGKSQKVQNLRRNPTITCMVEDGHAYNELRGVQIVGTAEIFDEPDRLLELGNALLQRHRGRYGADVRPSVERMMHKRVGIKVHPVRIASWDHTKL